MFDFLNTETINPSPQQIARSLLWLGWSGFWLQALLGFIPILVMVTTVLFGKNPQRSGFSFSFGIGLGSDAPVYFRFYR
jgi:Protein of unknown function (DUF3611)